jgi:preprotein translocase subunit SecY
VLDPVRLPFDDGVTLVTGTMFLMWLGEQITERGLGNGISIIIFAGIAAGLPNAWVACSSWSYRFDALAVILICVIVALVTLWCSSNVASARSW